MANVGIIKHAVISTATGGDNTIVAGVTGKHLRVLNYLIHSAGTVTVTWKSGASADMSGSMALAAGNIIAMSGEHATGLMTTAPSANLVLNLSVGAVQVSGHLSYVEI